jgi:hypothetical protein
MHKSLAESLSRFTPDSSGLDRDALLFAAGQASARRPVRTWRVLVGALAACQLLTLVLLWPQSKSPTGTIAQVPMPAVATKVLDTPASAEEPTSLQALTRRAMESADGDLPRDVSTGSFVVEPAPLRAFSAPITID